MLPLMVSCISAAMFAVLAEKMVVQLVIQIGDGRVCIYMLQQKLRSYALVFILQRNLVWLIMGSPASPMGLVGKHIWDHQTTIKDRD
jgi:hypothetical protein